MYSKGQGVAQDYGEAARWNRLAAEQGFAGAQTGLGLLYLKGEGVAQDDIKAHMWVNLAAVSDARWLNLRKRMARLMTPEQIAEAQRLAAECKARDYKGC